ncbi:cyclin-dependent kinase 2-interacting protein-like isoform X2 [Athalia rosae]|uniref:cyclin-dependent kinase 2-interacting protein-like isoform X2 n=1 Tax=Athalia rosae TaxID=37344 RepID=UPI0020340240|nr:cyclin-dependent kinase 2-interacting protein-like isoform X2 [Athalia rosae]XP_048514473.1 cyclin-dependent kinase 2-interacting protein-like isoform X2 [Athalia rosae]
MRIIYTYVCTTHKVYRVLESPVAKTPQRGNLTGNPRLVRDIAADIHSSIQQWNNVHLHAVPILKNICQLKIDEKFPDGLQDLCDILEKDCQTLDEIVCTLKLLSHQMNVVASLNKGPENLFLTWPTYKFGEVTEQIYNVYKDEAEVKRKVLENVAHNYEESWKMLHLTTWVHQVNISENVTTLLESLLVETSLR